MKQVLLFSTFVLISFSCNKPKDLCVVAPQRIVETFTNTSFKRLPSGTSLDDMVVTDQNELVIAGLHSDNSRLPFLSLLNDNFTSIWEKTPALENSRWYRNVRVIASANNNLLFLTHSGPDVDSIFRLELIEYDKAGWSQWKGDIIEDNEDLRPVSIINSAEGGYIILSSISEVNNIEKHKFHLSKVSSIGTKIWSKFIDAESIYLPSRLTPGKADGSFYSISDHFVHAHEKAEVHVYKFNSEGDKLWSKEFPVNNRYWPLSTYISSFNDDILISYANIQAETGINQIFLKKLSPSGSILWEKSIEYCGPNFSKDLLMTSDGNIILLSNTSAFGNRELDVMVTKMDSSGNVLWEKVYGGKHSDQGRKILERPDGNFFILGNTNENTISEAAFEGFIFEINKDGLPL